MPEGLKRLNGNDAQQTFSAKGFKNMDELKENDRLKNIKNHRSDNGKMDEIID